MPAMPKPPAMASPSAVVSNELVSNEQPANLEGIVRIAFDNNHSDIQIGRAHV